MPGYNTIPIVNNVYINKNIKHPSEALFVIVLRTPTKELSELPIFNSA